MLKNLTFAVVGAGLLICTPVLAGVYVERQKAKVPTYCYAAEQAQYLVNLEDGNLLYDEVVRRYNEAVDASHAQNVVYSNSDVFTWANETKVACAKVIGHMRDFIHRSIDPELIQKCECFHARMTYFGRGGY